LLKDVDGDAFISVVKDMSVKENFFPSIATIHKYAEKYRAAGNEKVLPFPEEISEARKMKNRQKISETIGKLAGQLSR